MYVDYLKNSGKFNKHQFCSKFKFILKKLNTFIGQEKINENFGNFSCITPCYF